jgi:hypothetical protein
LYCSSGAGYPSWVLACTQASDTMCTDPHICACLQKTPSSQNASAG